METDKLYPLSAGQKAMYVTFLADPKTKSFNLPYQYVLPIEIDLDRLEGAIRATVIAHPALKARIKTVKGVPMQYHVDADVHIGRLKMTDNKYKKFIESFVQPYDIFSEQLFRFNIISTESKNYLVYDINHIVCDGFSLVRLMKDLSDSYSGKSLLEEGMSTFEAAVIEADTFEGEEYKIDETYYDYKLNGKSMTEFPPDFANPTEEVEEKRVSILLQKLEIGNIKLRGGISPNQLFCAATNLCLSRICREQTLTIATLHNGRTDKRVENTIGLFVKTLPLSIDIKNDLTVSEYLSYMKSEIKELFKHQTVPFIHIYEKYKIGLQIFYAYQGVVSEQYYIDGKPLVYIPLCPNQTSGIDVMVYDKEEYYELKIRYNSKKYSQRSAIALGETIKTCAKKLLENPDEKIKNIDIVEDVTSIIELSKGAIVEFDVKKTFIDKFKEQVAIRPNCVAVEDQFGSISYDEIDQRSDILAQHLFELGLKPNVFVGVMMPRIYDFITAVIAIWKAGGAYVPLDNEYPNGRLLYMIEDSKADILITTKELLEEKREAGAFTAKHIIFIDSFDFSKKKEQRVNNAYFENLAYMIYTSCSTGNPKGVMIQHKALSSFIKAMIELYTLTCSDKICCHSSFSFDASVEDLYPILTVGGEMHIIAHDLRFDMRGFNDYINKKGITGGGYTTQFGVEFLTQFDPKVRYFTVGGEKMDRAPMCNTVVYNTYGPTEFTVDATIFKVENGKTYKNIPIGRPLPNSRAYIMDLNQKLLPRAFAGELCMAGLQSAKGYWEREELTNEKFIQDTFFDGEMIYRTGDLVRWNDDDDIEYLGRIDNQVKLRGFRIELGEIESYISNFDGVQTSCVEVREVGVVQHLCAYYTLEPDVDKIDIEILKDVLSKSLTEYMVPSIYLQMESMPLTPAGKINRKALPTPQLELMTEYIEPQNQTQRDICEVFEAVLHIPKVSIIDNFFEIGGTSLIAIHALIQIENKGYTITYGDLFRLKTSQAIAEFIDSSVGNDIVQETYPVDDYDYSSIDLLLKKQRRDYWTGFNITPLENILLTGATGYLGSHILYELINNSDSKIYCLLRAKKNITVEQRLKSMLMYYFGCAFDELFGKRIFIIEGDITDKDLAEKVTVKIDTVINCAALVKHYEAGTEMEKINYEAVGNLADYCVSIGAKFIHISTYSTGGVSINDSIDKNRAFKEDDLFMGQVHILKYTWTKFLAERLILQKIIDCGLRAKIMRVGNLMGRAEDGEFQANFNSNAFVNSIKAYKVLGMFPLSRMVGVEEESPIDKVAAAIIKLSQTPDDIIVLHPYNVYSNDMGAIIKGLNDYGFPVEVVPDKVFDNRFSQLMKDSKRSAMLSGILHSSANESVRYVKVGNDVTTTILYRMGFYWSQPDKNYIRQLISMLDSMAFFDEK